MKKQTKTYYGPYELTDHLQHQFVVTCGAEHDTRAHARPPSTPPHREQATNCKFANLAVKFVIQLYRSR